MDKIVDIRIHRYNKSATYYIIVDANTSMTNPSKGFTVEEFAANGFTVDKFDSMNLIYRQWFELIANDCGVSDLFSWLIEYFLGS